MLCVGHNKSYIILAQAYVQKLIIEEQMLHQTKVDSVFEDWKIRRTISVALFDVAKKTCFNRVLSTKLTEPIVYA